MSEARKDNEEPRGVRKMWRKYSASSVSVFGLLVVILLLVSAVFARIIAPYPAHAGLFVDFANANQPPSFKHLAGTDIYGRDVMSRILVGLRYSLGMGLLVLALGVPFGVAIGLLAGYYHDTWVDTAIMRFTELFMAIPPLILAFVVCAVLSPGYFSAAIGIGVAWWPWYARLTYSLVRTLSNESYIVYAELSGAKASHIVFKEVLPNAMSTILTKMSLDMGIIIIIASSMSFVGLGIQPPKPSLGAMISGGIKYLPEQWWISIFPALFVVLIVLGFNLLGDGVRDALAVEDV